MSWFSRKPKTNKSKITRPVRSCGPIAQKQWEEMKTVNKEKTKKPVEHS